MKRLALLCGVILLFAGAAAAQDDDSKVTLFGGYSYVRVNPGNNEFTSSGLNFNGGSGSIAYKVFPMISVVGDVGGYHWSGPEGEDATAVSYMFGPKASFHAGPITPFVQTLFGGTHISGSGCNECCDTSVVRGGIHSEGCGEGFGASDNAFSLAVGGGLDWNATPHIGVRLIQAEYYMTRFFSETQNNARISAGVTFRF